MTGKNLKICEMITDRVIEEMEKGLIPWEKPWFGTGTFVSHTTGKPYSFANELTLAVFSRPGEFITFNQVKSEGGTVKKGAKGLPIIFWKQMIIEDNDNLDEDGKPTEKTIPILRYYTVFHIDDCNGIKSKWKVPANAALDPDKAAEKIITEYEEREKLSISRTTITDRAFYSPSLDYISVPAIEQYQHISEYYSTLFHEMTHSTGHKTRLNRFTGNAKNAAFGSEEYSKEELIAEIGAAALVNSCELETSKSFENSTAYLQGWLKALKNDKSLLIVAAGKAEKAVEYIRTGNAPEI